MDKTQLAELYANMNLIREDFIKLPVFAALEDEADALQRIVEFQLPEVIKLICCSDKLSQLPWAEQYAHVRPLYIDPSSIDLAELLEKYPEPDDFKKKILTYSSERILNIISTGFGTIKSEETLLAAVRKELKKRLNEEDENSEEIDKKLKDLDARIDYIRAFLKKWKKHKKAVLYAMQRNSYEAVSERRDEAYAKLFPPKPAGQSFLDEFISNNQLTASMKRQISSGRVLSDVLECLSSDEYKSRSMSVIMALYALGAIDIDSPAIADFIRKNADTVSQYLLTVSQYLFAGELSSSAEDDDILLRIVIDIEFAHLQQNDLALFREFWNTIASTEHWLVILNCVCALNLPDTNHAVGTFLNNIDGSALEALIDALLSTQAQEMGMNPWSALECALHSGAKAGCELAAIVLRKSCQLSRSAQRRLRTADRKLRGQAQELFMSLYEPVEQLELLASDLRMSEIDIPLSDIASHIVELVASLREGLLQMDLLPVCDIAEWRDELSVPFNPECHIAPQDIMQPSDKVVLRTMGFKYTDSSGEHKQFNAYVAVSPTAKSTDKQPSFARTAHSEQNAEHEQESTCCTLSKRHLAKKLAKRRSGASPQQKGAQTLKCGKSVPSAHTSEPSRKSPEHLAKKKRTLSRRHSH